MWCHTIYKRWRDFRIAAATHIVTLSLYVLICFWHIRCFKYNDDCTGPAAGLILTLPSLPIRLWLPRTVLDSSEVSSGCGCSENNTLHDNRNFLAESIDAYAINWMLNHAVSRLKSSNIGTFICMYPLRKILGRHAPPLSHRDLRHWSTMFVPRQRSWHGIKI